MTEPIPVLSYRFVEYERRPIFTVLAILAIASGLISEFVYIFAMIQIAPRVGFDRHGLPDLHSMYLTSFSTDCIMVIANLFLIAGGVTFLVRSKQIITMLYAYLVVSLFGIVLNVILQWVMRINGTTMTTGLIPLTLYPLTSIPRAIFDLVVLMLLRAPAVRQLIFACTGIEQAPKEFD